MTSDLSTIRAFKMGVTYATLEHGRSIRPVNVGPEFWTKDIVEVAKNPLISSFMTDKPWPTWEMHPNGQEFILQLAGAMRLTFDNGASTATVELAAGHFVVVPQGIWHIGEPIAPGEALYVTYGDGTQMRPR